MSHVRDAEPARFSFDNFFFLERDLLEYFPLYPPGGKIEADFRYTKIFGGPGALATDQMDSHHCQLSARFVLCIRIPACILEDLGVPR